MFTCTTEKIVVSSARYVKQEMKGESSYKSPVSFYTQYPTGAVSYSTQDLGNSVPNISPISPASLFIRKNRMRLIFSMKCPSKWTHQGGNTSFVIHSFALHLIPQSEIYWMIQAQRSIHFSRIIFSFYLFLISAFFEMSIPIIRL